MEITYIPPQEERSPRTAIMRGVRGRCPNCGQGRLFSRWLKVAHGCTHCGEELFHERAQDFPPYITASIVGHIVLTLVLVVEARYELSLLAHMLIWIPFATILTLAVMQPIKGGVIGMQWSLELFGFNRNK